MRRGLGVLGAMALACSASSIRAPLTMEPAQPQKPAPHAPEARDDGRLPGGVRPTRYDLDLVVDPKESTFSGRARIGVVIEQPTRVIVLHAKGMKLQTVAISSEKQKHWAKAELRMAAHGKLEPEELVLTSDDEIGVGPAELDLQYEAPFGPSLDGLYRVDEGGKHFAFTQFEPNDARRAFPCFDEPGFKTPFSVTITTPSENVAVGNMPERRRRENIQTGLTSFEFATSPPLPTYLVAFAVGPLELAPGARDPVPLRLVALPGKTKLGSLALETGNDVLALLTRYFDIPYPYPKLDLVAVPEFGAGAMENAGLVTFREELVLVSPEHASVDTRRDLAGVITHELAHQWFGNLVTTKWWNDLWLNEGFATWMANKIVTQYKPSWHAELERVHDKEWVMGIDALENARKIRQPVRSSSEALEAFDGITYDKGASVLGMVEQWIGEDTFRRGVHDYLTEHRFDSATAEDLFSALGKASGKDVGRVMSSFADQSGVPLVEAAFKCEKSAGKPRLVVALAQREYRPLGEKKSSGRHWAIPVCARWLDRRGKPGRACTLLEGETGRIEAELSSCPERVVPNANEDGYYRYLLPAAELERLAKDRALALNDAERVGLAGDAWALVKSGDLAPGAFLDVAEALSDSTNHVVWDEIASDLREYSRALVNDARRPAFRARMQKLFGPTARRLGFVPSQGESEEQRLLRKTLVTALADLGDDAWARDEALKVVTRWLADPASVDDDLAEVVIPLAARKGDRALYDRFLERMKSATLPDDRLLALSGLTGFDDKELVERTLALALDPKTKMQDLRYVFRPLSEREATALVTYRWVLAHFDPLKQRLPSFVIGRITGVVGSLCDEEHAREAEAFFRPRLQKIEGADKFLDQAVETSKLCAALRAGQSQASERALGVQR